MHLFMFDRQMMICSKLDENPHLKWLFNIQGHVATSSSLDAVNKVLKVFQESKNKTETWFLSFIRRIVKMVVATDLTAAATAFFNLQRWHGC